MSTSGTLSTALRVLSQLRRDHRTVALIVVVPSVLLTLLRFLFDGQQVTFDRIAPPMLGLIPFFTMFIVTSVAMLRERTSGTLERLMSTPIAKIDLIVGYAMAFGVAALLQVGVASTITFGFLGAPSNHLVVFLGLAGLSALLGMALGLFASAFANSEFQAVQFMPAFVLPQLLVCGLFVPRALMVGWLEALSNVFPLTYTYDALELVSTRQTVPGQVGRDAIVLVGFLVAALILGAATLRRRTD